MADNEHVFPQEQFQPILEQSMALDGLLETADITISFKDIKKGDIQIPTCYGDIYTIVNLHHRECAARLFPASYFDV